MNNKLSYKKTGNTNICTLGALVLKQVGLKYPKINTDINSVPRILVLHIQNDL